MTDSASSSDAPTSESAPTEPTPTHSDLESAPPPFDPASAESAPTDVEQPAPLEARAPVRPDSPAFSDFDIRPEIVAALADVGIVKTFAIQELTLPIALAGRDLIGQARTGTGKTLGFGVPLLNRITLPSGPGAAAQALVIAPTRELAVQVSGDVAAAGTKLGARVVTIYGGRAYEPQVEALRRGVDVVVGTPGRLLDLAQQGHLVLGAVQILVLDEADEMLDLGFLPDIERLMKLVPAKRQTMLFSATMPGPIVALARTFLDQPIQIRSETGSHTPNTDHIDQFAYRAHALDKAELISRILQARGRGLTMIFTRTKRTAAKVAEDLEDRGFAVGAVHGDLGQGAREQALRAFRTGKIDVLVATDVAARGLDVEGITHVINYQAPEDQMNYVHRIGRTARAGASGTAITLVDWDDLPRWKLICDALELPFHEPVETYSTSEHLLLELDIPANTTGTLPNASRTRVGLDAEDVEDMGVRARGASRTAGRSSGRSSGPRSGGSGSGSAAAGGRSGSDGRERTESSPDKSDRSPRARKRTRGGHSSGDSSLSSDATATPGGSADDADESSAPRSGSTGSTGSTGSGGEGGGNARPRRRRRRPSGTGNAGSHAESNGSGSTPDAE